MRTVLFVGAGVSQARAIVRLKLAGVRVIAVDGDPKAVALALADVGEVVDFGDLGAVVEVGGRYAVGGVMTVAADRAVPVVAAVADALGLPGIGLETALVVRNKLAMRQRLASCDVPQPRFGSARSLLEARTVARKVGFPVVVKPVDSGGQRGVICVSDETGLAAAFAASVAVATGGEVIVESFMPGLELNAVLVARAGEVTPMTFSDRLRPPGPGFGVGWAHVFPARIAEDVLAEATRVAVSAVRACGLRDGIAFPQLLVADDGTVRVVEIAARIPAGQMGDLVLHGTGVDLLEIALRQACGEHVPDELVEPRTIQPLAIKFLTARPGPLPTGVVSAAPDLSDVVASPGVIEANTYIEVGETIRPVRLDIDRRGYVIAIASTPDQALARAEAAANLIRIDVA